jgi:hypothetical protein
MGIFAPVAIYDFVFFRVNLTKKEIDADGVTVSLGYIDTIVNARRILGALYRKRRRLKECD